MDELGRHGYRIGPGTLYPILHDLERQGFLRRDDQVVDGKIRKYYRITVAGRRTLVRAQGQLRELVEEVVPMSRVKATAKSSGARRNTG